MKTSNETERYLRARKKVEEIRSFFGNLLAYCLVIPVLAYVNWRTSDFAWVLFPAIGWGFGLLMHGFKVYGYDLILGRGWEERKIREFMSREDY